MSNHPVSIRGLSKAFGELVVLDQLTLDISPGERLAIIGPSGSGKSTLLRICMTLDRPDAGSVAIGDTRLWQDGPRLDAAGRSEQTLARRKVGMVFQHFNLFPHLSALGNVALAPRTVLGLSRADAETRARGILDRVGLGDKADHWPKQLSGGQKQRVAIARALAMEPDVLLLDEITSALDPELVGEVVQVVKDLASDSTTTMLLVTHQLGFARAVASRLLFMEHGRIVEQGVPSEVLDNPQEDRTRAFLGAMAEV
jgi:polar amino acid transport system ATP-binding protein